MSLRFRKGKIHPNKPTVYMMIGLSGSGKSSVSYDLKAKYDAEIVSSDGLRKALFGDINDQTHNTEVFNEYYKRIRTLLKNKRNVIADATNLTYKTRAGLFNQVEGIDCRVVAFVMAKPIESCKRDNERRDRVVPEYVINKQISSFQIPLFEEGFEEIIIDNTYKNFDTENDYTFRKAIKEMRGYDQKNPHHNRTLYDHCLHTSVLFNSSKDNVIAALYHDVGKLFTRTFDVEGVAHYYKHGEWGAYFILSHIEEFLELITPIFGEIDILYILFIINNHMSPFGWTVNDDGSFNQNTVDKWIKKFGEFKVKNLIAFHKADKER